MELKNIYKFSYDYLVQISKNVVSEEEINNFISEVDAVQCDNITEAYDMLLAVLQDFQMYPKVIKYAEKKDEIKAFIHFPDLNYCAGLVVEELSNHFINQYNSNSKRCWLQYSKGIISGAKYLSQFKNCDEFKKACDDFDSSDTKREAYALFLSTKIDNMGFTTACNWLKELGYKNYPKPDVHMKDISYALGLIDKKKRDIDCFEAMLKIARSCNVDPYKLDKLWWLICSGNFYRYNKQLKNPQKNKKNFINLLVKNCQ